MKATDSAPPPLENVLHRSVRTRSSLGGWPGAQVLTVNSTRLTIAIVEGDLSVSFDVHQARTPLNPVGRPARRRLRRP